MLQAIGKGIMIFGPVSSGAIISGNMIANVRAIGGEAGMGIYFDSAGTSNHSVTGNVIKNCEGSGIDGGGSNNDIVITGNVIENVNSGVSGAAIQLRHAARVLVSGNNIGTAVQGPAVAMLGNSDNIDNKGYRSMMKFSLPLLDICGDLLHFLALNFRSKTSLAFRFFELEEAISEVSGGFGTKYKLTFCW